MKFFIYMLLHVCLVHDTLETGWPGFHHGGWHHDCGWINTCLVDCGPLEGPSDGAVSYNDTEFEDVAIYSCNDGFELVGGTTRVCLSDNSWSGVAPICVSISCDPLSTPEHGDLTLTGSLLGDMATVTCDTGYVVTGSVTRTCLTSGWDGTPADCVPVTCPPLSDPSDGSVSTPDGTEFEDVASYSCDEGHELSGNSERCCRSTGFWSGTDPTCVAIIQCPALTDPTDGAVDVTGTQLPGTTATYTCDYGLISGDTTRYCLVDGTWSGTEPTCSPATLTDCTDVYDNVSTDSGVYTLYPCETCAPIQVYCDMTTDGGAWTVFQRREDGSLDFYLDWADYQDGFGDPAAEFWLGLDNIHTITSGGSYELMVLLEDFEGNSAYAQYSSFSVDDEASNYVLHVSGYSGTAGDSMSVSGGQNHDGQPFTTRDADNDNYSANCAVRYQGGWWYNNCHKSNLNGLYLGGTHTSYADGVIWESWKGYYYSMKTTVMMIRRL